MALARVGALLSLPSAVLAALALPTAVVVATIYFGTGSLWPETPPKSSPSTVVEWGGRSFTTRRGFKMWLEANGGNYRRWAKRHPDAAALLSGRPRPRRSVAKPASSPEVATGVPIERRAYLALIGLAAGIVAFLSISLVRRAPRLSLPAVALGGYGSSPSRFAARSVSSLHLRRPRRGQSFAVTMRPRLGTAGERGRSLLLRPMAKGVASSRSLAERLASVFRERDQFDLLFASICVGLGLTVGILVPLVLTR